MQPVKTSYSPQDVANTDIFIQETQVVVEKMTLALIDKKTREILQQEIFPYANTLVGSKNDEKALDVLKSNIASLSKSDEQVQFLSKDAQRFIMVAAKKIFKTEAFKGSSLDALQNYELSAEDIIQKATQTAGIPVLDNTFGKSIYKTK